jgi:uncharacterized protein (DUF1501 family)
VLGFRHYNNYPPTLQLSKLDDSNNGSGATGRWIPSRSADEYSATLARWFGLDDTALDTVFPNLNRFATRNLGFLE